MLGDRLGKWMIFKELGRGGMGQVFLAQEEIGGRKGAIKVLAAELAQESGFQQRFKQEIDSLKALSHPGIVRFYEAGFENGLHYYAMEFVEGRSLDAELAERGRLPWPEVLDLGVQICAALRHVHDHGIIHRDIKPPNLLRDAAGNIKLTDFGIAKVFAGAHLTVTGGVVGTAEYLSPEQAAGKPVTKKSDLYSLGVVFYQMLTGRTPFEGTSMIDLLHKHQYGQFDRPSRFVPGLPYEIDEIVCSLLEKDPAKRPADCLVLQRTLERTRARLERKAHQTIAGEGGSRTLAENPKPVTVDQGPGPATLMSRLMRQELDKEVRGGPIWQAFNRFWVIAPLLALVIGILVWTFWPASMETLYVRGSALMQSSERLSDMEAAWRDYLEPLERRFPDHPYQEEVAAFKAQLESARNPVPSEAQRLYRRGEHLLEEGRPAQAAQVWKDLTTVFETVPGERLWVLRAEKALADLDKQDPAGKSRAALLPVLERLSDLEAAGKKTEAAALRAALLRLYGGDAAIRARIEGK